MKNILTLTLFTAFSSLLLFTSCKNDDDVVASAGDSDINQWIYSQMDYWYYWTNNLPDNLTITNQNPEAFYKSLLYKDDRFSFIRANYTELKNLLNGITLESGFEYKLYLESDTTDHVIMQLTYIKSHSPAEELGFKRGDIIYQINGVQFTTTNYSSIINGDMNNSYLATSRRYNEASDSFEELGTAQVTPITYSENPILLDTVYEIESKKIGYLIYTFFSPGPTDDSNVYDEELKATFSQFKAAGIQELIVDLRFNSGGSETSVKTLTSLLAKSVSSSDLLFVKSYNDQVQQDVIKDYGSDFPNVTFEDLSENIGNQLSSGKIHFITSDRSASASEVTINSLKPYMGIFIAGDTTVGKDVGSITIYNERDPNNDWAIQPIIVKLVNANGQDYPNGLFPDVYKKDNALILKPLGDVEEVLLSISLAEIGAQTSRIDYGPSEKRSTLFNSLDRKIFSGQFILEE